MTFSGPSSILNRLPHASPFALQRLWRSAATTSSSLLANTMDSAWTSAKHSASFSTKATAACSSSSSSLSASFSTNAEENSTTGSKTISVRGANAVGLLPSYLADARAVETYDPVAAPNGALQLGVAESQLLEDLLVPNINQLAGEFTPDCIYYQPTAGRPSLRRAMAQYVQELTKCNPLDVDGLVVGAGCNAVLENLCFCLANSGDAVLIPTPYYAAFEFDLVARAALEIVPITTFDHSGTSRTGSSSSSAIPKEAYYPTKAALNAACERANGPPRILLISHPHNPLGICYPPHVLQECIEWCQENQVHLISDEIYAGSVYRPEQAKFQSVLELAPQPSSDDGLGLGPYIHWVYAMSKDFALSGLRVGVVYTENTEIRMPLQKLNDMSQISSQTQVLVENMMTHQTNNSKQSWTSDFREENHARLRARGDRLHKLLDELNIPYLPGVSGLFVWIDLREFLTADGTDAEKERTLYLTLVKDFGLLLTPGLSMRNELPGFFRCVFTAAKEDEFELALQRLTKFVEAWRK